MITADTINAAFEGLAGIMVLCHCRVLMRDKTVRGVSLMAIAFFAAWGGWNLYYYPSLGQSASGACAVLVTSANILYLGMALYYKRQH